MRTVAAQFDLALSPPSSFATSHDITKYFNKLTDVLLHRCLTRARLGVMAALSLGGMVLLLGLEAAVAPPAALPYLHPTLNAMYSCANLTAAYGIGVWWQWREGARGGGGGGGVGERQDRRLSHETGTKKHR